MNPAIKFIFLITSLLSGAFLFNQQIESCLDFYFLYVSPIFIISSIAAIFLPPFPAFSLASGRLGSFAIWLTALFALCSLVYMRNLYLNRSSVLFSTKYYWEEGVDLIFRANGTFRAMNHNMVDVQVSYGRYKIQDSIIVLQDQLMFGLGVINDTLIITHKGLKFNMKTPWRVNSDTMEYDFEKPTELTFTNNTHASIDSIGIKSHYSSKADSWRSLNPGQSIKYTYKKEGEYIGDKSLIYYLLDKHSKGLKVLKIPINGYHLELIKRISFEENNFRIELVFGNEILVPYQ